MGSEGFASDDGKMNGKSGERVKDPTRKGGVWGTRNSRRDAGFGLGASACGRQAEAMRLRFGR
jgi:hypothetical protein